MFTCRNNNRRSQHKATFELFPKSTLRKATKEEIE